MIRCQASCGRQLCRFPKKFNPFPCRSTATIIIMTMIVPLSKSQADSHARDGMSIFLILILIVNRLTTNQLLARLAEGMKGRQTRVQRNQKSQKQVRSQKKRRGRRRRGKSQRKGQRRRRREAARTIQGRARTTRDQTGGREAEVGRGEVEAEGRTAGDEVGAEKTGDAVGVVRDGGAGAGRGGEERGGGARIGGTRCGGRARRSCQEG